MVAKKLPKKLLVIGPCAVESREQVIETIRQAKNIGVDYVRLSLWKPRTKPGFEGMGEEGIKLLVEAAKMGVNPAVEPMLPEQAKLVMDAVMAATKNGKFMLWIGARNQNHYIQREIAKIASRNERCVLMVKNQVWHNEKHWEGIVEHCLSGGIKPTHLMLCHRGFAPTGDNPHGYRNIPDFDMAMRMKEKTGLLMLFDPSHTGGSVEKVIKITQIAEKYNFDGLIVEVHPNPKKALSDATQQLNWKQFRQLMKDLYRQKVKHLKITKDAVGGSLNLPCRI